MRSIARAMVVVLAATLGISGCAAVQENPKTATGAGVGAAGGALIGGLASRSVGGAVAGGLLGTLAGGAVGYYLEHQDKTRTQAVADSEYQPSQGTVVRVDGVTEEPATIAPGGTEKLDVTYTVLTPDPNQTVQVNETREVRHDGALVANPSTVYTRPNGTFTSSLPITLPPNASPGIYDVTTTVSTGDLSSRGISRFVVQ